MRLNEIVSPFVYVSFGECVPKLALEFIVKSTFFSIEAFFVIVEAYNCVHECDYLSTQLLLYFCCCTSAPSDFMSFLLIL